MPNENENQARPARATREAYGATLVELAQAGVPVAAVDADLAGSTTTAKLAGFDKRLLVDVGIAEQDMVGVAAGLSLAGRIPFTASFAVFGTGRCYDQIRNTVCYPNLNVKICPTHAGLSVGPDGGSHQMLEDIALMSALPTCACSCRPTTRLPAPPSAWPPPNAARCTCAWAAPRSRRSTSRASR